MVNGREEYTRTTMTNDEEKSTKSICVWASSMVSVNGSKASLVTDSSSFLNSTYGALSVYDGGEFTGENVTFMNNNPGLENFPSMRYNVICLSTVTVSSLVSITSIAAGGDGEKSNTSMWINAVDNCQLGGVASTYTSAFYITTLTAMDVSRIKQSSAGILTVNGSCFIPCNLSCTLNADDFLLSLSLDAVNESVAEAKLNQSAMVVLDQARTVSIKMNTDKNETIEESEVEATNLTLWNTPAGDDGDGDGNKTSLIIVVVIAVIVIIILAVIIAGLTILHIKLKAQIKDLTHKLDSANEMNDCKDEEKTEELQSDATTVTDDLSYLPPPPTDTTLPLNNTLPPYQYPQQEMEATGTTITSNVMTESPQDAQVSDASHMTPMPVDGGLPQSELHNLIEDKNGENSPEVDAEEAVEKTERKKKKKKKKKKAHQQSDETEHAALEETHQDETVASTD